MQTPTRETSRITNAATRVVNSASDTASDTMERIRSTAADGVEGFRAEAERFGKAALEIASEKVSQLQHAGTEAVDTLVDSGTEQLDKLRKVTKDEPLKIVLSAFGVGFVLAMLLRRSH